MIRHFAGHCLTAILLTLTVLSSARPLSAQSAPDSNAQAQAALAAAQQQARRLDQVLNDWYQSSKNIRKLEGEHRRFVFDFVFNVQKQASGRFYYESPDKGRIDLTPVPVKPGTKEEKVHPGTGKKVVLNVQPDTPQRWVCDGQRILVIDDVQKVVEQHNIPKELQGGNIMDGPLPFLFGMPPDKARARYDLQILSMQGGAIDLLARPKLAQDAANYKWARIRIEQKTMRILAVQMLNPAGTRETVYTFPRITINPDAGLFAKLKWWKERDPFQPNLKGYDIQAAGPAAVARSTTQPDQELTVPSVIGFDYQAAQKLLERAGFAVRFRRGEPAINRKLVHRVQSQIPKPRTTATDGSTVWLTLYMPAVAQTGGQTADTRNAAKPVTDDTGPSGDYGSSGDAESIRLPRVTGLFWKDAERILRNLECTPEFVQGKAAGRTEDIFVAYEQSPAAGTIVQKGQKVTLRLFVKPGAKR